RRFHSSGYRVCISTLAAAGHPGYVPPMDRLRGAVAYWWDVIFEARLLCSASALRETLKRQDKHLVLVIAIQRREESNRREIKYTHSVAVVRISTTLDLEYFKGRINHLHKS